MILILRELGTAASTRKFQNIFLDSNKDFLFNRSFEDECMNKKPDFNEALSRLLDSITNRKLDVYKSFLTKGNLLYTIVQNGYAFKTPQELFAMHEEWFKDQNWIWEGTPVNTAVGEDMAFALIKYEYRAKKEDVPFSTWLTYVFRLEDGEWRLIHDQNTALDFNAFAKSAGLNSD